LLSSFESQILKFIKANIKLEADYEIASEHESGIEFDYSAEDGWVSLVSNVKEKEIRFQIINSFLRLLVHSMCRYYALISHSAVDNKGCRTTFIKIPNLNADVIYHLPTASFCEYLMN
jgi:hypothetical protein